MNVENLKIDGLRSSVVNEEDENQNIFLSAP
jgi:hypothetical protein